MSACDKQQKLHNMELLSFFFEVNSLVEKCLDVFGYQTKKCVWGKQMCELRDV